MVAISNDENPIRMTEAEYLAFERNAETRHEYLNGEVFAIPSGNWNHNRIFSSLLATLYNQIIPTSLNLFPQPQRIKVTKTGLLTYADMGVIDGEPEFVAGIFDTIVNPIVIIEILSKTTEAYDRGEKFQHYRKIDTLQDYILILQDKPHIEGYNKQNGKWVLSEAIGQGAIFEIPSIGCRLALKAVYQDVTFVAKTNDNSKSEKE